MLYTINVLALKNNPTHFCGEKSCHKIGFKILTFLIFVQNLSEMMSLINNGIICILIVYAINRNINGCSPTSICRKQKGIFLIEYPYLHPLGLKLTDSNK